MAKPMMILGVELKFIALFAILAVAFYYGMNGTLPFGFSSVPINQISQAAVLSISNMHYETSNTNICPQGNCQIWTANLRVTGLGQMLSSRTYTKDELSAGLPASQGLPSKQMLIGVTTKSQACAYSMSDTGASFYKVKESPKNFAVSFYTDVPLIGSVRCTYNINGATPSTRDSAHTCDILTNPPNNDLFNAGYVQQCKAAGGVPTYINYQSTSVRAWYCDSNPRTSTVATDVVGKLYRLETPKLNWAVDITLNNFNKPETMTFSNIVTKGTRGLVTSDSSAITQTSSDGAVTVTYVGASSSGTQIACPNNADVSVYVNSALTPAIINPVSTTDTKIILPDWNLYSEQSHDVLLNGLSDYNGKVDAILNDRTNIAQDFKGSQFPRSFTGISQFKLDFTSSPIFYHDFVVRAKGDYLGVVIPATKPVVNSLSCSPFQSGNQGSLIASVGNQGQSGGVSITAACDSLTVGNNPQTISIAGGSSNSANFQLTGTAGNANRQSSCTVTARDANDASISSSKSVMCQINSVCTLSAQPPKQVQMNSDGTCQIICTLQASSCTGGQTLDSNACACVSGAVSPTVPPIVCSDGTPNNQCSLLNTGKLCQNGQLVVNANCNVACPSGQVRDSLGNCVDQGGKIPTWVLILVGGAIVVGGIYLYQNQGKGKGKKRR